MKAESSLPVLQENQFFLERPRLYDLIEKAVGNCAAVISAGEGYGKTYAVHSFFRRWTAPVLWVQLSERDNQPWHFWENYVKTIEGYDPVLAETFMKIGFPETSQEFGRFFPELAAAQGGEKKCVLVFDDFHFIQDERIVKLIERLLNAFIPGHTLILISRNEQAINLIPVLSKGRLVRIGTDDLRFTIRETTDYFKLRGITLSEEEISEIHRDTEGWAMGINLVAEEIKKSGKKYTHPLFEENFFKLVEDHIFAALPGPLQNYLVKLSVLEQWPLELLERTSVEIPEEYRKISVRIEAAKKASAFIWYDCYLHGYRIHHTFLDYLREKQKEIPKQELRQICAIAAGWYLENNLKMDAALFYERAGDYAGITGIVSSFPLFIPPAAASQLLEIIDRLAASPEKNEQDENYIYLQIICRGKIFICLSLFNEAQNVFREGIDRFDSPELSRFHARLLSESWLHLGFLDIINYRFNKEGIFNICFRKANRYFQLYPRVSPGVKTICPVCSYVIQISYPAPEGEFDRFIKAFADVPRMENILNGLFYGLDDLCRAEYAFYRGDINTAERYVRGVIFKAKEKNQYDIENRALFFLMRIILHRENTEELTKVIKQIETLSAVPDYPTANISFDITMGWLYSHLGAAKKVAFWLRNRFEASELYSMFRNYEALVKAKYLFCEGEYAEVLSFIDMEENKNGLGTFLLGVVEMGCLEAAARIRLGDKRGAVQTLEKTWQAASPNSLDMPFIETGDDMRALAAAAIESGSVIARSWLENIRDMAAAYGKNISRIAEQFPSAEESDEKNGVYLTRMERTILTLLAQGQTREEISSVMGQSLGKIKSMIKNIYDKLGAINCTDAIRIVFSLGILEKEKME